MKYFSILFSYRVLGLQDQEVAGTTKARRWLQENEWNLK